MLTLQAEALRLSASSRVLLNIWNFLYDTEDQILILTAASREREVTYDGCQEE